MLTLCCSALNHKNIVRFIGISVPPTQDRLYLVTELMERGSLRDLLAKKHQGLTWRIRLKLAIDAAEGM